MMQAGQEVGNSVVGDVGCSGAVDWSGDVGCGGDVDCDGSEVEILGEMFGC